MKRILLGIIKIYKKTISKWLEHLGIRCKYYPTCSEYTRPSYRKIWLHKRCIFRNKKNNKM